MSYPSDLTDKEWALIRDFFHVEINHSMKKEDRSMQLDILRKLAVNGGNCQMISQNGLLRIRFLEEPD